MELLIALFFVASAAAHMEFAFVNITESHDVFNDSFLSGVFLMLVFFSAIIIFLIIFDIFHMLQLQFLDAHPQKPPRRKTTRIEIARSTIV
ncbi:hypothetical protein QR680_018320 [Steinernema hermaphroditum]|uniref:Uncharacterized protein n=1 Tax=Steinernema hermaphroditum TaxID=289476 RepID=A0AA39HIE7_9BILA|nr:hypothetical protein QR680_018320 [Steinernema hermaphroditum]